MLEELIARVFATRNIVHVEHWNTTGEGSYARHMALGDFYAAVIDKLDTIVEAHVGMFGPVKRLPKPQPYAPDDEDEDESDAIIDRLEDEMEWIEEYRDDLARDISAIANMIDELAGVYLAAIYKLKRLM